MEIKVYVADLGAYSAGYLIGDWFTLPMDEDELREGIQSMLKMGEEWAIHDYEAPFSISEYENIFQLNEKLEGLDLSDIEDDEFGAIVQYMGMDEGIEKITSEEYRVWNEDSMADIAFEFYTETGLLGEAEEKMPTLASYIDWERVGRDMEIEGTFIEVTYGKWVEIHN